MATRVIRTEAETEVLRNALAKSKIKRPASSLSLPPVAILCGGEGTRANLSINKCFVDINGKPMILRIMEQMEDQGFSTFVLCRGTSGTLQALREARLLLETSDRFLVLYGDTLLPIDFKDFLAEWTRSHRAAATATYNGVDAGVNGFSAWMLDLVEGDSLVELQTEARDRHMVFDYRASDKWHEVGTPDALAETLEWLM